jgi:UDP-3-O-[3-hydroxymyristoyl] N-acetylglucosamine deacetylase
MAYRTTLRTSVACTGVGLHTGRQVALRLRPAPAGHGVRFWIQPNEVEIPARVDALARLDHATSLSRDGVTVHTVEHLLSALRGLGVDDARIELDGPEVPVLDGSAMPFVELILAAGLRVLDTPRVYMKVLKPIDVAVGGKRARLSPCDGFEIDYMIAFDHPLLRHQQIHLVVTPERYAADIAPARTFGFLRDIETLRQHGLARGGTLDNAVVFGEDRALTPQRFSDESVRHKVLDAIGDLALLGHPLLARLEVVKGGHALHAALARHLLECPDAYVLVEHPDVARSARADYARAAL